MSTQYKKTGIELIADERGEQIEKHGRTIENDVLENSNGELRQGAYVLLKEILVDYPVFPAKWNKEICKKMAEKPYKERLIIAGALIAAEIDRLQNI